VGAIALGALALLAHACGGASPEGNRVSLDNSNSGQTVSVGVLDTIEITLQAIGPGQYGDPVISSDAVVFLEEDDVQPPDPGGPRQRYRFVAVDPGRVEITIPRIGPGPGTPFTISLNVR
jgi:hypothetical protein